MLCGLFFSLDKHKNGHLFTQTQWICHVTFPLRRFHVYFYRRRSKNRETRKCALEQHRQNVFHQNSLLNLATITNQLNSTVTANYLSEIVRTDWKSKGNLNLCATCISSLTMASNIINSRYGYNCKTSRAVAC